MDLAPAEYRRGPRAASPVALSVAYKSTPSHQFLPMTLWGIAVN